MSFDPFSLLLTQRVTASLPEDRQRAYLLLGATAGSGMGGVATTALLAQRETAVRENETLKQTVDGLGNKLQPDAMEKAFKEWLNTTSNGRSHLDEVSAAAGPVQASRDKDLVADGGGVVQQRDAAVCQSMRPFFQQYCAKANAK